MVAYRPTHYFSAHIMSDASAAKRLSDLFKEKGWKQQDVAKGLGYKDHTIINKYLNGKQNISDSFLLKLATNPKYRVSPEFIRTGKGDKYVAAPSVNGHSEKGKLSRSSQQAIDLQQPDETNVRLVGLNDPDVYQPVKFISYTVWATFTDNFGDFDFDDVKTTYPVYLPPLNTPINEKHMVFEIMGDSMEERLFNRDIILTELIDEGNIEYLNSGIYVVAYRNQLVVKRIIDNDLLINGTLTLHSDNRRHGKIVVRRDDIRYIWRFVAVVFSRAQ